MNIRDKTYKICKLEDKKLYDSNISINVKKNISVIKIEDNIYNKFRFIWTNKINKILQIIFRNLSISNYDIINKILIDNFRYNSKSFLYFWIL